MERKPPNISTFPPRLISSSNGVMNIASTAWRSNALILSRNNRLRCHSPSLDQTKSYEFFIHGKRGKMNQWVILVGWIRDPYGWLETNPYTTILGGGFKYFFWIFTPKIGENETILTIIFFRWVVQPPTSHGWFGIDMFNPGRVQ